MNNLYPEIRKQEIYNYETKEGDARSLARIYLALERHCRVNNLAFPFEKIKYNNEALEMASELLEAIEQLPQLWKEINYVSEFQMIARNEDNIIIRTPKGDDLEINLYQGYDYRLKELDEIRSAYLNFGLDSFLLKNNLICFVAGNNLLFLIHKKEMNEMTLFSCPEEIKHIISRNGIGINKIKCDLEHSHNLKINKIIIKDIEEKINERKEKKVLNNRYLL